MRSYLSWLFLSAIACGIALGAAFSFGASGLLVIRAITVIGGVDPTAAWTAIAIGLLGALGTPTAAALWMAAALRSLVARA